MLVLVIVPRISEQTAKQCHVLISAISVASFESLIIFTDGVKKIPNNMQC